MAQKVILIADPGIDTAFAVALALHDPAVEVLGLVASAGNVSAEQATQNVYILNNALEPTRWPRLGAALPVQYPVDGTKLHGPDGLGNLQLPPISLHQSTPGDKVIAELVRAHPGEVTVVVLGPATVLARAFDRDPELPKLLDRVILLGGTWHQPGNAGPVSEFHFYCDPEAARQILRSGATVTLVPLDVTRKLVFSPSDLLELPAPESATCTFLRKIVPYGIRASSNLYGIEGFHLKDVMGIVALVNPTILNKEIVRADVELQGELTRGMLVVDTRLDAPGPANIELALNVDLNAVRTYINRILSQAP